MSPVTISFAAARSASVVCIAIIVVVVRVPATSALGTTRLVVVVVVAVAGATIVTAGAWRWEVAGDVLNAVLTPSEDHVAWASSFATLDIRLLPHVVRLSSLAGPGLDVPVATRLVVVIVSAVSRHCDGVQSRRLTASGVVYGWNKCAD
jgi:hypothetical protein